MLRVYVVAFASPIGATLIIRLSIILGLRFVWQLCFQVVARRAGSLYD